MAMRNKFPAPCYFCKEEVKAGEGFLTRKWGHWFSHCLKCYEAKKLREKENKNE